MKAYLAALLIVATLTVGCTSPTQPPAERDLQVAAAQFNTITYDLAIRVKYNAMMRSLDIIKTSNDPAVREKALLDMSDAYADVEYLLVQAERAQGLLRSGREWVRAQRGIFDVLISDAKEAMARVDAKQKPTLTTTSMPAS